MRPTIVYVFVAYYVWKIFNINLVPDHWSEHTLALTMDGDTHLTHKYSSNKSPFSADFLVRYAK